MTQNFGSTLPTGWGQLSDEENERNWAIFRDRFGFTPGIDARSWPAIAEPIPSVVFDLGAAPAATPGAWAARVDAINAEALRCFVTDLNDDPNFVVLDWPHPGYTFDAEAHAAAKELAEWRVPVYPNGDYYIFSRDDFTEGPSAIRGNARCVCSGNGWSKDWAGLCRPGFRDFESTVNRSTAKSVSGSSTEQVKRHQPRSRHSARCGRSAPSVVSLPCPG